MRIEAENLVIGRGPVGVVTSHALLEKNRQVLNLDLGFNVKLSTKDLIVNSNINYTAATKPPSLVKEANEHLWGGACMGWQYFEESNSTGTLMPGLPISEAQFKLASKKLMKILQISKFNFSSDRPSYVSKFNRINGLHMVFAKIVKDPYMTKQIQDLHLNPSYDFLPNVIVEELIDNGSKVECKGKFTDSNQPVTFVCKRVFLAAGTISNTNILIQSQLDSVNENYLGKYLSDHVSLPIALMTTSSLIEVEKNFGYKNSAKGTKLWPRAKIQSKEDGTQHLDSFCYVTEINASSKMGQKILVVIRRFPILSALAKMKVKGTFKLNLFTEVSNLSSNGIKKGKQNQDFTIDFQLDRNDLATISKIASNYIEKLSTTSMMKSGETSLLLDLEHQLRTLQAGSHPSGSYRMSTKQTEGVVNSDSQLHLHPNIYVLGAGAFPRSAATHPTFTAMALALIAVDSIED